MKRDPDGFKRSGLDTGCEAFLKLREIEASGAFSQVPSEQLEAWVRELAGGRQEARTRADIRGREQTRPAQSSLVTPLEIRFLLGKERSETAA